MNETKTTAPLVSVGIPDGVDKQRVQERTMALIAAGTNPLAAEKLAIDAELSQAARDKAYAALEKGRKPAAKPEAEAQEKATAGEPAKKGVK